MRRVVVPPDVRSWVPGADASEFPIQSLPYGFCEYRGVVVRIGDFALYVCDVPGFGEFVDLAMTEPEELASLRETVVELLRVDSPHSASVELVPVAGLDLTLPHSVDQFVDFYSGIHHASNVGRMFRPDQPPLLANYCHLPVGYNGRANTVVLSGTSVTRPNGQRRTPEGLPSWGPSRQLDLELELGYFTRPFNAMGEPISIERVEEAILGVVLLNDWSARDIQAWEYQPLGPFLAKSFATTISPWIVPLDALEPFRRPGIPQDPPPLPYLRQPEPRSYDIELEVLIQTSEMTAPETIARSNARHLYWSFAQQLAHQASNGTPLGSDLYGTGTISGPDSGSEGSLLELTWRGERPVTLSETGETRTFLQDGDTLTLKGRCVGEGYIIGFGECTGSIAPAPEFPAP